jgi:hypothetical protein
MDIPARSVLAIALMASIAAVAPAVAEAQAIAPPPALQPTTPLSFDQYKAQQVQRIERVQATLAERLAAQDLAPERRQRLERMKARLDKVAALPPDQRDALLRHRFERMDANRDGVVDAGEFQAFRQSRRQQLQMKQDANAPANRPGDGFWPAPQ